MIITQTPLRVSLLGGGTDFEDFYKEYGGAVLTTTIDKYVFVIVKERFDEKIVLNYSERETTDSVKNIRHDLIRESMRTVGVEKGIEITTLADVPSEGTGLGSSSSILVGLLHALYAYLGILVTAEQLASQACNIEINILKRPIGKQDQYIAAYGGLRLIKFSKNSVDVNLVDLDSKRKQILNDSLLLFFTGMTRDSSTILSDQKSRIGNNNAILKRLALLAELGEKRLVGGTINDVGKLLHENWELKKMLSARITNQAIEDMYKLARDAGAVGGKIVGAGSGGFMLLCVNDGKRDNVREAMKEYRELPFNLENDGSKIIFNCRKSG